MKKVRLHYIFRGNVQGVGFRYRAYHSARMYGVTGYVRNLPDGSVEMEAQGSPLMLQRLLSSLKGQFEIDDISIEKREPLPHERGFRVL